LHLFRHGHEQEVVAIKAHRHFDLSDDEAMLEEPAKDCPLGSDTRPVLLQRIAELEAKPSVLALAPNGHWSPVQFGEC